MTNTVQETGSVPKSTLADRLRKAREHAGLEQAELAERMGVGRNTVSNYERASHAPREIVLRAWAMATGVPVEWLRTGDDRATRTYRGHLTLVHASRDLGRESSRRAS